MQEGDTAGFTNFTLSEGTEPSIYFDVTSLKINGQAHTLKEQMKQMDIGPMTAEVKLYNQTTNSVNVKARWYYFEDSLPGNKLFEQNITLPVGNNTAKSTYEPKKSGAYVVVFEINNPQKSLLKYRFAIKGGPASSLSMGDLGITKYLPDKTKDKAYVCFYSPDYQNSPETKIVLSLLDGNKQTVDSQTISGSFGEDISAISLSLAKLTDTTNFWVRASFEEKNSSGNNRTVEVHYEPTLIANIPTALSLSYDQTDNSLIIDLTNGLGKAIANGGFIESIRLKNETGVIIQDVYNLKITSNKYPLKALLPGKYQAEVRTNNIKKSITFTVEKAVSGQKSKLNTATPTVKLSTATKNSTSLIFYLVGIIVLVIILAIIIYQYLLKPKVGSSNPPTV